MALQIHQTTQKPNIKGGPGFNTWPNFTGTPVDPWINIMAISDVRFPSANGNPEIRFYPHSDLDPNTGLPLAIPTGYDSVRFGFNFTRLHLGHPSLGDYVLRYTGLTPGYSWATNASNVSGDTIVPANGSGEVSFSMNDQVSWFWELIGPEGPLPAGYEVYILRQSDIAAFDNTTLPITHATRLFKPEFLALLQSWEMSELRMMDVQEINNDFAVVDMDYHFPVGSCFIGRHANVEYLVSLCNHMQIDLFYNFPVNASDAYKQTACEYIRDNLEPTLHVTFENANEMWNNAFRQISAGRHAGISAVGNLAPGTVSVTKGVQTLTSSDMDLTTVFGPDPLAKEIAIVGAARTYTVDRNNVTPGSVTLLGNVAPLETLTNAQFYYPRTQGLEEDLGNVLLAQKSMKIVTDVFEPAGQLHRVTRALGGKFNDPGRTNSLLYPSDLYSKPDYTDPKRDFDAMVFNPYFGSGSLNNNFLTELQSLHTAGNIQGWRDLYTECLMGRHPIGVSNNMLSVESACRAQWQICRSTGLRMLCYEAGPHILQDSQVNPEDTYIFETYNDWKASPQAAEIFQRWGDIFIKYFDGPVQKFTFMGTEAGHFGDWSTITRYDDPFDKDELVKVMASFRGRDPWWDDAFPPQLPIWIDPVTLTSGVGQIFNLNHYFSNNVRTFSAASVPPGMALWHNGVLTGVPTPSAKTSYVFTGANDAGAVDLILEIQAI